MNADLTSIIYMVGLTIVAFMIAINTQGRLRMIFSYTLATILFGLTAVVFFNHAGGLTGGGYSGKLPSEPIEKGIDDRHPTRQTESGKLSPEGVQVAAELKRLSAEGAACANSLQNKELKDESVELETLVGRASETRRRVESIRNEFERVSTTDVAFRKPLSSIKEGIQLLSEAAQLYFLYYYAEDSNQEVTRENLLRQKAKKAKEEFQKTPPLLSSMNH